MTTSRNSLSTAACWMVLVVAALAGVVEAGDRQDQDRGGSHGNLAQRWVDAWNSHDASAVAALFTNDAVFEDVAFGIVNHGPEEIRAFAQFFFTVVPDLHVNLVKSSLTGGQGTIEWVFSGTDQGVYGTGKTFAVRGVTVLEARGARISRNSDYFDLATLLRQLGLLPSGL
jgi:steroid delta-isomerase-like uncharacterized protein